MVSIHHGADSSGRSTLHEHRVEVTVHRDRVGCYLLGGAIIPVADDFNELEMRSSSTPVRSTTPIVQPLPGSQCDGRGQPNCLANRVP